MPIIILTDLHESHHDVFPIVSPQSKTCHFRRELDQVGNHSPVPPTSSQPESKQVDEPAVIFGVNRKCAESPLWLVCPAFKFHSLVGVRIVRYRC